MSEEIIKVLEHLCDKMGVAIDWTSSNVLPYLEELCQKVVRWEIGTSVAWIFVAVLAVAAIFIAATVATKKVDEELGGVLYMLGVITSLFALGVVLVQVFDVIKYATIPEMAIYDYITKVIGGTS